MKKLKKKLDEEITRDVGGYDVGVGVTVICNNDYGCDHDL